MSSAAACPSRNVETFNHVSTSNQVVASGHTLTNSTRATPSSSAVTSNNMNEQTSITGYIKARRIEVAAGMATVLTTTITFPLDHVKNKLQAYPTGYGGVIDCVRDTYIKESPRAFFRGLPVPLATITAVRTLSMSVYTTTKDMMDRTFQSYCGVSPIKQNEDGRTVPTPYALTAFGVAGALAGAASSAIACPFELVKLATQLSAKMKADAAKYACPEKKAVASSYAGKGTLSTMWNIKTQRGFTGLYTGFPLHLVRDMVGTSIYFVSYEAAKQVLSGIFKVEMSNNGVIYAAGGICGAASWILIYPLDRAKAEYQRRALEMPLRKHPPVPDMNWFSRVSYRGLVVSMSRSFLTNMLFFGAFENFKKRLAILPDHKL